MTPVPPPPGTLATATVPPTVMVATAVASAMAIRDLRKRPISERESSDLAIAHPSVSTLVSVIEPGCLNIGELPDN
jgi:hypothetical protein